MNELHVGLDTKVVIPDGGCLHIDDEWPDYEPWHLKFDPRKHHFNPLLGIDMKRAKELARVLYSVAPEGSDTLTVRNGRRALARLLLTYKRLDRMERWLEKKGQDEELSPAHAEVLGMLSEIMFSDVLPQVLCSSRKEFSFNPNTVILARINRQELGDDDALALVFFLLNHYKGQVVVRDFGFYGRNEHIRLIREKRLVAQVDTLEGMPERLVQNLLLMKSKFAKNANFKDAELIARNSGLKPDFLREDNEYNKFIKDAM